MKSLVVIAPAALWPMVRYINRSLGYEPGDGVPLSPTGALPPTHRGLHDWADELRASIATGARRVIVPGYSNEEVDEFLGMLTVSVDAEGLTGGAHFDHACSGLGLVRVEAEDE